MNHHNRQSPERNLNKMWGLINFKTNRNDYQNLKKNNGMEHVVRSYTTLQNMYYVQCTWRMIFQFKREEHNIKHTVDNLKYTATRSCEYP